MTIYFDEDGAKVDDQFVHIAQTSIRISEIQKLTEQEHQPGWEWPVSCFIVGGLALIVWLPAPIDNYPPGLVGGIIIAFGWFKLKNMRPRQYWLTVKAGGFASFVTFKSENKDRVDRFRSAVEASMAMIEPNPPVPTSDPIAKEGTTL